MKKKLRIIWHILRASSYTAVVNTPKHIVIDIKATKCEANDHLIMLIEGMKQVGIIEDDTAEQEQPEAEPADENEQQEG